MFKRFIRPLLTFFTNPIPRRVRREAATLPFTLADDIWLARQINAGGGPR